MSNHQLTIKAYYLPSTEVRRLHLTESVPFAALRERLLSHLPPERRSCEVTIKYLDDEDEWVTISELTDEEEWRIAKTVFKQPILRLRVCLLPAAPAAATNSPPAFQPRFHPRSQQSPTFNLCARQHHHRKPVHWGVVCDGCQCRPIRGIRYKCNHCLDFDFCESCFARAKDIHDPSHAFTKYEMRRHPVGWDTDVLVTSAAVAAPPATTTSQKPEPSPASAPAESVASSSNADVSASKEPVNTELEKAAEPALVPEPESAPAFANDIDMRSQEQPAPVQTSPPIPEPSSTGVNWWSGFFAPPQQTTEFAAELATLDAMGLLDDRDRAIRLLRRRRGNLQLVANDLLQ